MDNSKKIMEMLPLVVFIIAYFVFHLFDWMEVTQFIAAVIAGTATFIVMVMDFREEHKNTVKTTRLSFYVGLTSLFTIVIIFSGFLHWYRMISLDLRMILLFILMLLYIIILLRGTRVLSHLKSMAENK